MQHLPLQVMVITGDNKLTAEAICRTIGVFEPEGSLEGRSLTGREFVELPLEERKAVLRVRTASAWAGPHAQLCLSISNFSMPLVCTAPG